MFKRKLTINDFPSILVNLIPVYGVWFEGWDAAHVFLVYCLETVIVGIITVLKMAGITIWVRPTDEWENNGGQKTMQSGWFFIFFFIVHYGFFVFVQTQIFLQASDIGSGIGFAVYNEIPELLGPEGILLLVIFFSYNCWLMIKGFILPGTYKTISLGRLMFQPYTRIFVQQFIVILGSMFLSFGAGKAFIVIVAGTKMICDLYLNIDKVLDQAAALKEKESGENGGLPS